MARRETVMILKGMEDGAFSELYGGKGKGWSWADGCFWPWAGVEQVLPYLGVTKSSAKLIFQRKKLKFKKA